MTGYFEVDPYLKGSYDIVNKLIDLMGEKPRVAELKVAIKQLKDAGAALDQARELYLGQAFGRNYGLPVSRLLNWQQESLRAIIALIEDAITEEEAKV